MTPGEPVIAEVAEASTPPVRVFRFLVLNPHYGRLEGTIEAVSEADARERLRVELTKGITVGEQ